MRHSHVVTSLYYRVSVSLKPAYNSLSMGSILEDAYPFVHSNLRVDNRRVFVPSRISKLLQKQTGIADYAPVPFLVGFDSKGLGKKRLAHTGSTGYQDIGCLVVVETCRQPFDECLAMFLP